MAADSDKPPRSIQPVTIGRHCISPGERVFIVAEAGVNHNGSVASAIQLVAAATQAGADAVKFQFFRAADVATASAPTADYQRQAGEDSSQRAMLARLELSLEDFSRITKTCDEQGILFLATPFCEADLIRLMALKVPAIKIASTDLTNPALLRAVASTSLPLILSTGASTLEEMQTAIDDLRRWGVADRLLLMHCVSAYPTPPEAINLRAIATLERTFGVGCGLSDHTTLTFTGAWATAAGACLLEKHFTLDRSATGPDHAMSLEPGELAEYVRQVRSVEHALGSGELGMTELEAPVRAVARKSVVAAVDIRRGTKITVKMLAFKRPGTGIAPGDVDRLIGRPVAIDISRDTVLSWDMLQ